MEEVQGTSEYSEQVIRMESMNRTQMNAKIFLTGTRGVGMMTGPRGLGQCHSDEWMQGEE